MENRAHALAAGLFTVALGFALLAALWWFSNGRESMRHYLLETTGNVTGLNLEAQVRYRGISVGKVSEILIDPENPRKILVLIRMKSDIPLTRGTRAALAYQGVTGLAYIQLTDKGEDPTPLEASGDDLPRIALAPGLMDQLSDTTLDTMRRVRVIADRIDALFDDDNIARLDKTLRHLESAAGGVDRTFADAPRTLEAIRNALKPENTQRLEATLANLEQASAAAAPALIELRQLMTRLGGLVSQLDSATGVAGDQVMDDTLPKLNELLRDLSITSQRIGRLAEDIDTSPQMLLLGRPGVAPGPGERGFVAPVGESQKEGR